MKEKKSETNQARYKNIVIYMMLRTVLKNRKIKVCF